MSDMPVCKFYLQGRCAMGGDCKFRHSGRGIASATAFTQPDPTKAGVLKPGAVARLVDRTVKATFTAGAVPVGINFKLNSAPVLKIDLVETSLDVTWYTPTRNIWLQFSPPKGADDASKLLNGAEVKGVKLVCTVKTSRSPKIQSLQISSVTRDIKKADILNILPKDLHLMIKRVDIGSPSCALFSVPEVIALVKNKTTRKMVECADLECKNPLRLKTRIKFEGCPRLDDLASELDGSIITEGGKAKFSAVERIHVRLLLDRDAYNRRSKKLKRAAGDAWRRNKVQVHIIDDIVKEPGLVEISMTGTDRKAMAETKASLDDIFIREMSGTVTPAPRPTRQTHHIRLTKTKAYRYAKNVGFPKALEMFESSEPKMVQFDDTSDPPAVIVRGNTATLREVERCLRENGILSNCKTEQCAICADRVTDFIKIESCSHLCCRECFASYCANVAVFPMRCFEVGCATLLRMNQIRSMLKEEEFDALLAKAITDSVKRQPDVYAQCPNPDCDAHFRVAEAKGLRTCPKCFTACCPQCKVEYHFGKTCEQHQDHALDLASKMAMLSLGVKPCPGCGARVEKIDGCNHIDCAVCKTHFCFICLKVFPGYGECYAHLHEAHGGFFDDEIQEEENMRRIVEGENDG